MSIKKFRTFEEASKDLWILEPNEEYNKKLRDLFYFWNKLNNRKSTKSVQKFKRYEDFLKIKTEFD